MWQLLLVVVFLATPRESPPIALRVSPHVGYRPLTVEARITVEPYHLNRAICIQWISANENYDGRSCWQAEGQYAARTHYYTIRALPTGTYHISATVYRVRGSETTGRETVRVIDSSF